MDVDVQQPDRALVTAARAGLAAVAEPARAGPMRAYMRSAMPFRGVPKPPRAALARRLFAEHPVTSREQWIATVRELWDGAAYREERYLAVDLTGARQYRQWQTPDLLPLYQHLVVTGAWWDHVDEIASRRIGPLLLAHPDALVPAMHAWAGSDDLWQRRTAIICQLPAAGRTDLDLLTAAIEAAIGEPEFFLRKAIGWALRQHARTDPGWVRAFVAGHPDLAPLSVREATKHL